MGALPCSGFTACILCSDYLSFVLAALIAVCTGMVQDADAVSKVQIVRKLAEVTTYSSLAAFATT